MTCFWDGIISSLDKDDLKILGLKSNPSQEQLAKKLMEKNIKTTSILWQNKQLSDNELAENYIHIADYTHWSLHQGYLCSTCDPFLCLISELLMINIDHTYLDNTIHYKHPLSVKTVRYKSDRGHFWLR